MRRIGYGDIIPQNTITRIYTMIAMQACDSSNFIDTSKKDNLFSPKSLKYLSFTSSIPHKTYKFSFLKRGLVKQFFLLVYSLPFSLDLLAQTTPAIFT